MILTSLNHWLREPATEQRHYARSGVAISRRAFTHSTLAATALAALPARPLWADTSKPAVIPAQVNAIGLTGKPLTLTAADIKELRAALRGPLLLAADEGYDTARRIWDPSIDHHPALIARCSNAQDVIHAVNFARTHQLRTAVRAGGHSVSGQSTPEGGLMIDVSPMKEIRVDARQRRAYAQGGVLLGELDHAMQAVGLVTTLGTVSDTGIAGLTLGGGVGLLMRRFGLSIDNLISVDVVTADGKLLHASEQENSDLFWGLRGGGGNFGVATAFEYRLHPLQHPVLVGFRAFPYSAARSVFTAVAELADKAPDELFLGVSVQNVAAGERAGRSVGCLAGYTGEDPAVGLKLLEPLAKLGKPLIDTVAPTSYLAAQSMRNDERADSPARLAVPSVPKTWYESGYLYSAPDALFDEMIRRFDAVPPYFDAGAGFSQMGGAIARVKQDATAFWNRPAKYDSIVDVSWSDSAKDEEARKAARDVWTGMEPFTRGHYVNTVPGASSQRVRATYG
ncbi:MAG TPA: FAD-binding oxidoreductase, partial [Steroidobacteraceae bacterium]|nr:FAD-binding oxidoreductase [Steroidobacteraceae bacterium]